MINLNLDQYNLYQGAMMEQLLLEQEEMVMLFLETLLIDNYHGLILKLLLIKKIELVLIIVFMK
jgi:hypothetical protein